MSRRATSGRCVAAKICAPGRSAASMRAVFPSRVTATIATARPRSAKVTAASQSARPCSACIRLPSEGTWQRRQLLRVADDRVEGLDSLHWILARGRLPRQHDRIDAVVHGIGGVADLRASRTRLLAHRLEHLRRDDDGTAERARAGA